MSPPPLWLTTSILQLLAPDGFTIRTISDIPCHLWLYWSNWRPWVHKRSGIRRGLPTLQEAYWCFGAPFLIEQITPGDTLFHIFYWNGWVICQTKYFYFQGTIGGIDSPSQSAIFTKHFPGLYVNNPLTEEWTWLGIPVIDYKHLWTEHWG